MHYLLFYEKGPDAAERQKPHAEAHRAHLSTLRGMLLGGNMGEGATLLFDNPEEAERCAREDPYVIHGIVERWSIRPWDTVVGSLL